MPFADYTIRINVIWLTYLDSCIGNKNPTLRRRLIVDFKQDVHFTKLGIYGICIFPRIDIKADSTKVGAIHFINLHAVL